jgi:hypothetical protein
VSDEGVLEEWAEGAGGDEESGNMYGDGTGVVLAQMMC